MPQHKNLHLEQKDLNPNMSNLISGEEETAVIEKRAWKLFAFVTKISFAILMSKPVEKIFCPLHTSLILMYFPRRLLFKSI